MKKQFLAVLFGLSISFTAFACGVPGTTCTSAPTPRITTTVGITGNVNNSIAGASTSSLGQGGASFAAATAGVNETATASGLVSSNKNSGPNGVISGGTSTAGNAYASGISATVGTGQAATNATAYGTGTATQTTSLTSKNSNASLNLSGTATSANQVGIGYATQSSGNGIAAGKASVAASASNSYTATGLVNACTTPINGKITDVKAGTTLTNAPVVNSFALGNASGGAISPFTNGSTGTASQSVAVVGSFAATK